MNNIKLVSCLMFVVFGLMYPNLANAQLSIPWYTIDGGGGASSGGSFQLEGTIGQHDATQTMSGGTFSLTGGFWANNDVVTVVLSDINVFRGVAISGGLAEVQQSDDLYLRLNPGFTINSMEAPVWVEFFGTSSGCLLYTSPSPRD